MKLKFLFILSLLSITSPGLFAQQKDTDLSGPPAKTIFGEMGGPGLFSANYDQRFKGQKGWGFRVGMGGIGFITSGVFAIPVGFNHLSGKDGHYLELGAGASAITVTDGGNFFENSSSTVFGYLNFGYRYQPEKKGFTARVFVSPLITGAGVFPFYGGISAGFKF
ncbi:MAG: hypothetical protein ACOYVG_07740 [Bacteroidota bacterium]